MAQQCPVPLLVLASHGTNMIFASSCTLNCPAHNAPMAHCCVSGYMLGDMSGRSLLDPRHASATVPPDDFYGMVICWH